MQEQITNFATSILAQISQGLASTLGILILAYIIFWVILAKPLRTRKVQLVKRAGWTQIKDEIINTIIVVVVNTFFVLIIFYLRDNGLTKFYNDTGRYGWWYEILVVLVLIVISDGWFYLTHRIMHGAKLYKFVHAEHHKSLDTTPFTSNSFHVLESLLLTIWVIPAVMLMPVSLAALGVTQVLGLLNNLKSHLGYELYPKFFAYTPLLNMLATSTHHNLHHTQYNGNYGLFFRFWDVVLGTELKDTVPLFKEINDRKKSEVTIIDNTKYLPLIISRIEKETDDVTSIYFEPQDSKWYNYQAGQYLNIRVRVGGKWLYRCFSLSSSPLDKFLRITTKLNGEVTHFFHNVAKVGDNIDALLPVGDFVIKPESNREADYLMIAGGSGITPLYSMINTMLVNEPKSSITLMYSNRSVQSTIFLEELEQLQNNYPQLQVVHFYSGTRLSKLDLETYMKTHKDFNTFICGPQSLKQAVREYLHQLGVNEDKVKTEDFVDGYVPWFGLLN